MSQIYNIHLLPKDNAATTTTAMLQQTIDRRSLLTQAQVLCEYIAHIVKILLVIKVPYIIIT